MKIIRNATTKDKEEFRALWDIAFTDSIEFREWFFENRYIPEYSICMEEDGKLVSVVQSIPYFIKVRNSILKCTMMVGALTHPDYTKRGYMKELYTWYMNYMNRLGITLAAHTPAVLRTYFYVGHLPVSDTAFIEVEKAKAIDIKDVVEIDLSKEESALLKCYSVVSEKYSGIIVRSLADMRLKCADYMADGGKAIGYIEDNEIKAYGVYYNTEEMLYAEEVIALSDEYEQIIVNSLISLGVDKKVKIKLPSTTKSTSEQGSISINPRNVLGLASVKNLLKAVGNNLDYSIEVVDNVVLDNDGIFNLKGEDSKDPVFKINAGNLTQWLIGYKSLLELKEENLVKVYKENDFNTLDRLFPKQNCHIVDEY